MTIIENELQELTEEYGGRWGIYHSMRLLKLISIISEGIQYDQEIVVTAAYLHDWGAFAKWAEKGIDHALKSKEVAEAFLRERGIDEDKINKILECIEYHHTATTENSIEAILISDADILDFFGTVGILREFSRHQKDMRKSFDIVKKRREELPQRLVLEKSITLAKERLEVLDHFISCFQSETFGLF